MKLIERTLRDAKYKLTSKFNKNRSIIQTPVGSTKKEHNGTDYGTYGVKAKIYALEDGVVTTASKGEKNGNYLWVEYPRLKIKLKYLHCDKLAVKKGQKVDENTILGYVGQTGAATGIHLHLGYQVIGKNEYLDPELYDYKPKSEVVEEWIAGKYEILADKYMRKSTSLISTNLVKYSTLTATTKKQCTNKNGYAQFKKGAKITISKIVEKDGRIWGEYAGASRYLVLCNVDGTPQAKKV